MKKVLIAAAAVVTFMAVQYGNSAAIAKSTQNDAISSTQNEKVTICHREGNGSSHEITVSIHAVPAHLAHGDAIGSCNGTPTRQAE